MLAHFSLESKLSSFLIVWLSAHSLGSQESKQKSAPQRGSVVIKEDSRGMALWQTPGATFSRRLASHFVLARLLLEKVSTLLPARGNSGGPEAAEGTN